MLTKDGEWSFSKSYDALSALGLEPREHQLLLVLWRMAARGSRLAKRLEPGKAPPRALTERQLEVTIRRLAGEVSAPLVSTYRAFQRLENRGLFIVLNRGRTGRGKGVLVQVAHPDQIADLARRKLAKVEQIMGNLTNPESLIILQSGMQDWNTVEQKMEQMKSRVSTWINLTKKVGKPWLGTSLGTLESLLEVYLKRIRAVTTRTAVKHKTSDNVYKDSQVLKTPELNAELGIVQFSPTPYEARLKAFCAAFPEKSLQVERLKAIAASLSFMKHWVRSQPKGYAGRSAAGTKAERQGWPIDVSLPSNRMAAVHQWWESTPEGQAEAERRYRWALEQTETTRSRNRATRAVKG